MLAQPSYRIDQSCCESRSDIFRHTFIELRLGVVDAEVPVPAALIEVVLTFEYCASDI